MCAAAWVLCGCLGEPASLTGERIAGLAEADGVAYGVNIDDMAALAPIAIERMHWGLASQTNRVTALRTEAWTPDDRPVTIVAHTLGDRTVEVRVRVGRFGDAELEQRLHDTLNTVIADHRENQGRQD